MQQECRMDAKEDRRQKENIMKKLDFVIQMQQKRMHQESRMEVKEDGRQKDDIINKLDFVIQLQQRSRHASVPVLQRDDIMKKLGRIIEMQSIGSVCTTVPLCRADDI